MKKTIYQCDECERVLSDEGKIKKPHLSITFAEYSGWVAKNGRWEHTAKVFGVKQFCNAQCLARFFNKLKVKPNAKRK